MAVKKYTASTDEEAAGVPGIAFEVSAQTGAMTPLVYAQSLSASANPSFSKLIYQTASGSTARTTYAHDVASGKDLELPFNPLPEKCAWSSTSATPLYCAAPLTSTPANYLDLWHQGLEDTADSIFAFDIGQGITNSVVAVPAAHKAASQRTSRVSTFRLTGSTCSSSPKAIVRCGRQETDAVSRPGQSFVITKDCPSQNISKQCGGICLRRRTRFLCPGLRRRVHE